jgi:hemerythrin-like domain-containing protein
MKTTEQLRKEHKVIRLATVLLEILKTEISEDLEDIEKLIEFFTVFVDKCHHGKEERILFPALEKSGIPNEGGPIQVMLEEHETGRTLLKQIKDDLQSLKSNQTQKYQERIQERIKENISEYLELLERHIQKGNNVLFVMADMHLDGKTQEKIFEEFEDFEIKEIGSGKHDEFHKMINEMKSKILGKGKVLDVRDIPPVQRHGIIFSEFDGLKKGENFVLINDHDPKPLWYQFQAEKEGKFSWEYIIQGPIIWAVKIGKI